jgi:PhnB protein
MPIIAVGSVDDVRNFYVDTLGFEHVMGMVGKDGRLDFCTVVLGQARIMFMRAPGGAARPAAGKQAVEIYLEVENVDGLHDCLKKKGVTISDPLTLQWWGDRTFKVFDPNGYEIWFYTNVAEPKPPQGAKLV